MGMSCLQHHQLTGTHKGAGADVSKLLVSTQKSEKKLKRNNLNVKVEISCL